MNKFWGIIAIFCRSRSVVLWHENSWAPALSQRSLQLANGSWELQDLKCKGTLFGPFSGFRQLIHSLFSFISPPCEIWPCSLHYCRSFFWRAAVRSCMQFLLYKCLLSGLEVPLSPPSPLPLSPRLLKNMRVSNLQRRVFRPALSP